ncbi:polysaccharide deacetylase family protein [Fodinicurvata sp. EGI_FJ10296]|uniref:polysaccharide deacetylase family protein n=1 Tax=Fodinicurvata sp. EGI_FJ10296 TaxID=3231908 RepID=UPI0034560BE2
MTLAQHGRYDFSPIFERPTYQWPDGNRLAVYFAINIEHFEFGTFPGSDFTAVQNPPYHRGYAWRDYGNRVGVWRLLQLFDELKLPVVVNLNTSIYNHCPQVLEPFRKRGDEIVCHGRTNSERQAELDEAGETRLIAEATDDYKKHEGKQPAGWLGPWISQSPVTPDLLKEHGYSYMMDWPVDDQPIWFRTRSGPILSVPYPSMEVNDSPAFIYRRVSEDTFSDMIVDDFDERLYQAGDYPLVCPIALHTFIVGQPLRLRRLRRALEHIARYRDRIWLTRPGAIAKHVSGLPAGTVATV